MGRHGLQRSPWRWVGGLAVVIACLLAGLQSRPASGGQVTGIAALLAAMGRPFVAGLTGIRNGLGEVQEAFVSRGELRRENEQLKARLAAQSQVAIELAEAEAEVTRLRGLVAATDYLDGPAVAARVIARGPSPWFQILILDRGAADGLRVGAGVMAAGGLIGQLYEVADRTARVLCLTDRLGSVGARLQPERVRHVTGVARGDGEAGCVLTTALFNAPVQVGDPVVTSGEEAGSQFPAGLPLGRVTDIERRPQESLLICTVEPSVDPRRVEEVLVWQQPVGDERDAG